MDLIHTIHFLLMLDYHPPGLLQTVRALQLAGISYRAMVPILNEVYVEELVIPLTLSSLFRFVKG